MQLKLSKQTIGLLLSFIFLCFIISATFIALSQIKSESQKHNLKSLQAINHTTQEALQIWVEFRKLDIKRAALDLRVLSFANHLIKLQDKHLDIENSQSLKQLRIVMAELLEPHSDNGFFIINKNRINIASMRDENLGHLNLIHQLRQSYLDRVFAGETLFIPTIPSDVPLKTKSEHYVENLPTIFIASPLLNKVGKVIAVLTFRLNPAKDFTRIIQLGRLGNTGETYAIDNQARLITESRFDYQLRSIGLVNNDDRGILTIRITDPGGNMLDGFIPTMRINKRPLTFMAQSVIAKKTSHNLEGYRDYRGVNVIGAWSWSERFGFGIATEINLNEAMRPYYESRFVIIVVSILTIILAFSLLFLLLWLDRKNKNILNIAYGQLEEKVNTRTKELAALNRDLEQLSLLDGLTNIANRRMFDQTLSREWKISQRNQTPISLIMIDIDFFKQYNDTYGHQQGDACLIEISNILSSVTKRAVDLVARYGGEEFVLLLPDTNTDQAVLLAEKCRNSVLEKKIPHELSQGNDIVTISLGVSTIIASTEYNPNSLVKAADELLHLAKSNGRNHVESD